MLEPLRSKSLRMRQIFGRSMSAAQTDAGKGRKEKRKFSEEEDRRLRELVGMIGAGAWGRIAARMPGRTARQCRERYGNYLQPSLVNGPWTEEEESLLSLQFEKHGPKWATIARSFNSRSDVNIKNHWAAMMRRKDSLNAQRMKRQEDARDEANAEACSPSLSVALGCVCIGDLVDDPADGDWIAQL